MMADPLDQELQVGLDRAEIDVLGFPSRHQRVVIGMRIAFDRTKCSRYVLDVIGGGQTR
jgi:hypothetical protein